LHAYVVTARLSELVRLGQGAAYATPTHRGENLLKMRGPSTLSGRVEEAIGRGSRNRLQERDPEIDDEAVMRFGVLRRPVAGTADMAKSGKGSGVTSHVGCEFCTSGVW